VFFFLTLSSSLIYLYI